MTLAIDKMDGHCLSNTVHTSAKKTEVMRYYVVTAGTPDSSNKMECFSYKGEWVNAQQHIQKKVTLQLQSNTFGLNQLSTVVK